MKRDLPIVRSLKLRLLRGQYVAGASFFYSVAHSLHALASDTPLSDIDFRERAIAIYREMCDIPVADSALSLHKELEKETWGVQPQGGPPEHFAGLAEHGTGNVVLLHANT